MDVLFPRTLQEALELKARRPEAVPIAGGTDLMVELNFDRTRPAALLDVSRLAELGRWERRNGRLALGAGVTYSRIMRELTQMTALRQACRTVGSPQIRNRGTVGGNLGTASPAGDALPVLAVHDAEIVVAGVEGSRVVPWDRFLLGPKRNALHPDELIIEARWNVLRGPGSFSKVGTRNAMVISMVGLCLQVDEAGRTVRVALGSVAPTVVRATEAEEVAHRAMERAGAWDDPAAPVEDGEIEEFAGLVADAARPIDDVRGTAAYRRHACRILAARALRWALADRRSEPPPDGSSS